MKKGAVAGYPVINVKAEVYDGSYHDVDSSEIAFKIAGARAFHDGMAKAKPVLLEPIMTVRITVPDHYMGDVNGTSATGAAGFWTGERRGRAGDHGGSADGRTLPLLRGIAQHDRGPRVVRTGIQPVRDCAQQHRAEGRRRAEKSKEEEAQG